MLINEFLSINPDDLASPHARTMVTALQPLARKAMVVRADNVAHYLFVECAQEEWDLIDDFPCVTPPFPITWIEWRIPALINSEGTVSRAEGANMAMAALFDVIDLEKETPPPVASDDDAIFRLISTACALDPALRQRVIAEVGDGEAVHADIRKLPQATRQILLSKAREAEARGPDFLKGVGVRWIVRAFYFARLTTLALPAPYEIQFFLRDDGRPMMVPGAKKMFLIHCHDPNSPKTPDRMTSIFFVPLLTLSFLNCKNVRRVMEVPKKLNKARVKKGKPPFVSYYTLEIDPMRKVLREEGQSETVGLKRALHITRGHFADYTAGKGLFGKYHGQFWVPQHVKGSASQGVVNKDYAVQSPQGRP